MGSRAALVAAFATVLVWSSSYTVARLGLRHFDPVRFTALRLVAAAVILSIVAVPLRVGLPDRGDRLKMFSAGFIGMAFYLTLLNIGLEVVESVAAAIIISLAPILVAVMSMGLIGERLTRWGWMGLWVAFVGVVLVVLGQGNTVRLGVSSGLVLVAALAHAVYIVMTKPLMARYRPVQVATWAVWSASLVLLPALAGTFAELAAAPAEALFSFVFLGFVSSAVGFILWGRALTDAPASVVASSLYATPPLSALIGWLWLGERPTIWVMGGGAIILGAVALVIRRGVIPS